MPNRIPSLRPERIVNTLQACGLELRRQRGSHAVLFKPGLSRPVIVAMHSGELPPGYIRDILRQAQVSVEEFLEKL